MDELKITDMADAQAQSELLCMQRRVDDLLARVNEAMNASMKDRLRADRMERACYTAAEDWKADLEAMEKHYQVEISHLQNKNEELKDEVVEANKARELALRMSRDAMLAGEAAKEQVASLYIDFEKALAAVAVSRQETWDCRQLIDELTKQKADFSEAYAACQTTAQAGAAAVAEKEAELKKQSAALFQAKQEAELLRWELFESRKNETRLCEMSNELDLLKKQLAIAKQTEHEQAKVVMDTEAKLQEANLEVQLATAEKNEVATSLSTVQGELQEIRTKWMLTSAEVIALTAKVESMKSELETQQMQMVSLHERNAESEAKLLMASEDLAGHRAREHCKDEALNHLGCSLEAARAESQLLRLQLFESILETQFRFDKAVSESELELTEELFSLHILLEAAERLASQARADLHNILYELCSERDFSYSTKDSSTDCASAATNDSLETIEMNAHLYDACSLEAALAVCKPAALTITSDLKMIREQLDRIREDAELLVGATSESNSYKQEDDKAQISVQATRRGTVAEHDQEAATTNFEQFQKSCDRKCGFNTKEEVQGKRELLEPWEIVDSSSEATVTIKKEEYESLKFKVHEAMESKSFREAQLLSLRSSNQKTTSQLDATKVEIKALRLSEQSIFQQYDKLQQQNMSLEAELQKLKGKGEQFLKFWETGHEAYGLTTNKLQCPQPTLDSELSVSGSMSLSEKEEDSTEFLSLSTKKKKKKALYLRVGTFLTKKMN